jgi:IS5 family transposase
MKKITTLAGTVGAKVRDRSRSVTRRLLEIGRAVRGKAAPNRERLQRAYGRLLDTTGRVVGQARRFAREISAGVKRCTGIVAQAVLDGLRQALDDMIPLVRHVMRQTRVRIFGGLFEPSTEVIRKGKAGKPTEFGKLVKLQEAEPDHRRLRGLCPSAQRRRPVDPGHRSSSRHARAGAPSDRWRRRLLLRQE